MCAKLVPMAIINEGMGGLNELSHLNVKNIKVPEKEVFGFISTRALFPF